MRRFFLFTSLLSLYSFGSAAQEGTPMAPPPTNLITLSIPGIVCMSCATKISGVLKNQQGVSEVFVDVTRKETTFRCNEAEKCDVKKISLALKEAKYRSKLISKE